MTSRAMDAERSSREDRITTCRPEQIEDTEAVLDNLNFTEDELQTIDNILAM